MEENIDEYDKFLVKFYNPKVSPSNCLYVSLTQFICQNFPPLKICAYGIIIANYCAKIIFVEPHCYVCTVIVNQQYVYEQCNTYSSYVAT